MDGNVKKSLDDKLPFQVVVVFVFCTSRNIQMGSSQ
jgi:hypothetical protein